MDNTYRPVWLTREFRDWLERFADNTPSEELSELARSGVAAWDAAPADAAESVREALDSWFHVAGMDTQEEAVLRALGMPE